MSNKKEKNIKHINKRLIVTILLLITVIVSSTFAWFTYSSNKSALVLTVGDINRTRVTLNPYQIKGTLEPTTDYTGGVYTNVEVINNDKDSIVLSLYYKINELNRNLIDNGLKYTIVKSETEGGTYKEVYTGDFTGSLVNEVIFSKVIAPQTNEYYKVYLWLDSDAGDQTVVQGLTLNLELNGRVEHNGVKPVVENGMIPVTIDNDGTVTTINETDTNWYNYSNKEWANVVLVKESSGAKYLNTTGVEVLETDITAYYVWVPRYKYSISDTVKCSDVGPSTDYYYSGCYSYTIHYLEEYDTLDDFLNGTQDYIGCTEEEKMAGLSNGYIYCSSTDKYLQMEKLIYDYNEMVGTISYTRQFHPERTINSFGLEKPISIIFEDNTTPKSMGSATGNSYLTHPAFTYGNQELNGIWVGKFETTGLPSQPTVLPNKTPLTNQNISSQFQTALLFAEQTDRFGLSDTVTDAHMMKNSEWGAVAYLSHSEYGKNYQININNYVLKTGCGSYSASSPDLSATCLIQYSKSENYPQSTTGNISGIFDMAGGNIEYVMGNYNQTLGTSGFTIMPDQKYYDLYTETDFSVYKGHALSEIENWYYMETTQVNSDSPWYSRGSFDARDEGVGGIIFEASDGSGLDYGNVGFRSVLTNKGSVVRIKYKLGEGETIATPVTNSSGEKVYWTTDQNNYLLRRISGETNTNKYAEQIISYGDTIGGDGLYNYNDSQWINIKKEGYTPVAGAEWICLEGCRIPNSTFNQNTTTYTSDDFCDATAEDCTVVLGVNWAVYKLCYNLNGGTGNIPCQEHGGTVTITDIIPPKAYHTFLGWADASEPTTVKYQPGETITINSDLTLIAVYRKNTATIHYRVNSDENIQETTIRDGITYTWTLDSNRLIQRNGSAYRSVLQYEVVFTGTLPNYNSSNYLNITKPGYSATSGAEWKCSQYSKDSCNNATYSQSSATYTASDFCDLSTRDCEVTLEINWKSSTYTVKYEPNVCSSQTKTHDKALTLCTTKPTKTGYTFLGWTYAGTTYQPGASFTLNTDATLTAKWKANTYTVTYNPNGGSGAPAAQTKTHDVALTLSSTKPTRSGYTFVGWNESKTATTKTYDPGGSYTKNASTTLYAIWQLTVNANRYACENSKFAVYYVSKCISNTCWYSKKNGLDINNTANFSMDETGIPTGKVGKGVLYDSLDSLPSECSYNVYWMKDSVNCRTGASTSMSKDRTFTACNQINVYPTTMKYETSSGKMKKWHYSKRYGCYLTGTYLQSAKPSSCS